MGCGASKSPESVVAPQPAKQEPSQGPQKLAAAPALPESRAPSKTHNTNDNDCIMPGLPALNSSDSGDVAGTQTSDTKLESEDGKLKTPSLKILNVMVIAEPQCVEQETLPERPGSTGQELAACTEYERPPSSESENPARAAFRARLSAQSPDDFPPSPVAFKSSRSLNRSIGVRRRTTDQSLQPEVPAPDPPASTGPLAVDDDGEGMDKEDDDKDPDPLREQFELTKETNPLLAIGRNATGNGILSCKASEKSLLKSHKRLAVGFALDDSGGAAEQQASGGTAGAALRSDSGSCQGSRDLDPDDHVDADRIASLSAMLKEVPAAVVVQGES
ncbi:hypothetical protein VaNZ11_000753 [Volvox africanus]|uniref:Uncharacterized protein n=1 Tax=Volvox africanus TaxID=51714 RepID=A0ABQ5RN30_9CHLO|nr:hypothetical protein VaNZ11_000753 [Volvox africanus]